MQNKSESQARVFFALWPDEAVRDRLHALAMQYRKPCGARAMRVDTLHLTLHFLGNIARDRLPQLMHAAGAVESPPVALELDRVAFWRHNRIGYAGSANDSATLRALVDVLGQQLTAAGFRIEPRAFHPHVTLLRNVTAYLDAGEIRPVIWQADAFVLVESVTTPEGIRYQTLARWPLKG